MSRCLAHFKRDGLRVWCMLNANHEGPHHAWQGNLSAAPAAFSIQWNQTAAQRKVEREVAG